MTWQEDLIRKTEQLDAVQISINGSIYTLTSARNGITVLDPYRTPRQFPDVQSIISHWESNLENPSVVVL